jgi:hypothetical protein
MPRARWQRLFLVMIDAASSPLRSISVASWLALVKMLLGPVFGPLLLELVSSSSFSSFVFELGAP